MTFTVSLAPIVIETAALFVGAFCGAFAAIVILMWWVCRRMDPRIGG